MSNDPKKPGNGNGGQPPKKDEVVVPKDAPSKEPVPTERTEADVREPPKEEEKKEAKKELTVAEAIKEGISLGIAAAAQVNANQAAAKEAAKASIAAVPQQSHERCPECRQSRNACGGEHRHIAVYPQNARHGRWFQGIRINGETYLSNSRQHFITVPAGAPIEHMIQEWEHNEDELYNGREAYHDSGSLGPNGSNLTPASHAWR